MEEVNIYHHIENFFASHVKVSLIVKKNTVENYVRQLTWQGTSEQDKEKIWAIIKNLLGFMAEFDLFSFDLLTGNDYQKIIFQCVQFKQSSLTESRVRSILNVCQNFIAFILKKSVIIPGFEKKSRGKIILPLNEYEKLTEEIKAIWDGYQTFFREDGKFYRPDYLPHDELFFAMEHGFEVSEKDFETLNHGLENLMNLVQSYFREKNYLKMDYVRALILFLGMAQKPSLEEREEMKKSSSSGGGKFNMTLPEDEEFWLAFWDYFFWDYHLIRTDETPLRYFFEHQKDTLTTREKYILQDLLKARFHVFYVEKMNDDILICRDLLTDELLDLPTPEVIPFDLKKSVWFGHSQSNGMIMLNHISAMTASPLLRQRIKDEIFSQYNLFKKYQFPHASIQDFLQRHAAIVRHSIQVMTTFSQTKLFVDRFDHLHKRTNSKILLPKDFVQRFHEVGSRLGIGAFSQQIALMLCDDFVKKTKENPNDTLIAAAFVILQTLNGFWYVAPDEIIRVCHIYEENLTIMITRVFCALEIIPFDPRYLTEDGFVYTLFCEHMDLFKE